MTRVVFRVARDVSSPAERVVVCGSAAALGGWQWQAGLALTLVEGHWTGEVVLEQGAVDYRYLVVSDHIIALEGQTRKLLVAGGELVAADGQFGVFGGRTHIDTEWLLEHSQLRVRVGSRVSRPPVELYPAASSQPEAATLHVRASLSPVFGPPCACLPDVQIFSPSASRAALQPRAPHPNGEALIAGTFVEFIFRASAFDDAAVCLTLEQHGTPIGTAWLLPAHRATTHGAHTLPLVGPDGAVAGHVCVEHLQINPIAASLQGPDATSLATANGAAWDFDRRLMVGHRGMGSSHVAAGSDKTAAPVTENTLASFMQAFRKGADYVEFDVHVSRDRIPFVYHNFEAYVASHGAAATPVRVDLADYPLAQLQTMQLISRQQLSHLPINGSLEALLAGTATPPPTPNIDDERECPTLEKVLTDLPPTLGFDVEIKYPLLLKGGVAWENDTHIPREPNEYVDLILNTVMQHGGNRPLFFTCFDPDICLMLKLKQKKYPVAFLTCAGVPSHGEYEDLRCRSLQGALAFAAGQGMLGVAPDSSPIIEHPDHVVTAHSLGLALFTWGGKNNYAENVALQKKHNVDGIILDRIGLPH